LPVVAIPVIGRCWLSPVTITPLAPLRSALMPASVVPLSPRSTRPSVVDSRTETASSLMLVDRSSIRPMLLRCNVVRTIEPALLMPNSTPGRPPGSAGVPRSVIVESTASNWPLLDTTMNGRPGPTCMDCPDVESKELTVAPRSRSFPLPV
jgi:hypothetical protein